MPGLPRKASNEPLRHVTLQNGSGLRTNLLGPFLFGSLRRSPNSEPVASPHHGQSGILPRVWRKGLHAKKSERLAGLLQLLRGTLLGHYINHSGRAGWSKCGLRTILLGPFLQESLDGRLISGAGEGVPSY